MQEYLRIAKHVLDHGVLRGNRTDQRAISCFGNSMDLDISDNLAIVTTKKLPLSYIVGELLWMITGSSDVKLLNEISGVPEDRSGIWDEWSLQKDYFQEVPRNVTDMISEIAMREHRRETVINQELVVYQEKYGLDGITKYMTEHGVNVRQKIQVGHRGYIGPLYGHQWRRKHTEAYIDQFENLLHKLETDPLDRRHLLIAWDPDVLPRPDITMAENLLIGKQPIAPCHWASQYYVEPVLTNPDTPLLKLTTDESGNAVAKVNPKYLGKSFRIINTEIDECIGDFDTAKYTIVEKPATNPQQEVELEESESSKKYGISILRDLFILKNLSRNTEYHVFVGEGVPVTLEGGSVSAMLHMRSSDVFLGLPFNIAFYSLMVHLISREFKAKPKRLFVTLGDYHVYENHVEQLNIQLKREPFEQAKIEWDSEVPSLREIMDMGNSPIRLKAAVEAIVKSIQGYQSHASLKGEVAV